MGDEDGKIDRTCPVVVRIGDGTHLDVINNIRSEKKDGSDEGTDHALLVPLDVALFNLNVSQ
jgi:hypothetical protein